MTPPRLPTRFQIREALGQGGMGVVYLALDTATGQEVAIKLLPAGANEQMLQRMRHEAREQASLSHPNVVQLLDASSYEGQEYMVMELVPGGNLYDFLSQKPSLQAILEVFCSLCEGLEYVHSQGLVHRDLKPENMLFTRDGQLKIADLGVARRVDSDSRLTRSGVIVGTCEYVAPEQILSSNVTSSADLYSLGVTLFEALTGQTPFVGDSEFALLQAHLREKPPPLRTLQAEIPPNLELLVDRLLEKQPDNRPRSAGQVRDALRGCIDELGQDVAPSEESEEQPVARDVATLLVGLSQEIWNPMNGIIGMTRLLQGTELTEGQEQYCLALESSALALRAVFANLLDYTRLEAGQLWLDPVPTDVRALVHQVVDSHMGVAKEKGLGLYSQVDLSVPDTLICDPLRLRQVLLSLLSNALKFTHQGLISVAVQREHDEPGKVGLRIAVADTGVGMTDQQMRQLFTPSLKRSQPGAGLGLTVTRGLVQAMGGRIWAESLQGRGTTFTLTLRLPLGGEALEAAPDKPSRPLRILLAEDQPVNQTLATVLLQQHQHEVVCVNNGVEALARLEQEDFDAILMDLQMPEMDGLEATRRIRDNETEAGDGRHIPIIALTAIDQEHCLEIGMDAHVPKPLEEKELLRALARVVKERPVPELIKAEEPAYDERALLGRVGGSARHARTLVEVFLDVCMAQTEAIDEGFRAQDPAQLAEAVRNLRTSLEGIAAGPAARIATEIEQMTREGRLDAALHARRSLLVEIERLLDALTEFQES